MLVKQSFVGNVRMNDQFSKKIICAQVSACYAHIVELLPDFLVQVSFVSMSIGMTISIEMQHQHRNSFK